MGNIDLFDQSSSYTSYMRNLLLTFLSLFSTSTIFAQSEPLEHKTVADSFQLNYNAARYDSIFSMYSPEMKAALPLAKTEEFFSGLKSQAGKIIKRKFVKMTQGTAAVYKATFDKTIFTINLSIDSDKKINGFFIRPYLDESLPTPARNSSKLILPFKEEWTVIWGGDTKELNYHVESAAQKNAFDLVITDASGKSYKTSGKANEDYYAFGKEIIAPCTGTVVLAIDGVKDNAIGETNTFNVGGNMVILKSAANEYLVFCHFKHGSLQVKEGQPIQQGQLLGLCGNTGNSSEPHLHFHIQNIENINSATGVKCYFETLLVNGKVKKDHSPIQQERIMNENGNH